MLNDKRGIIVPGTMKKQGELETPKKILKKDVNESWHYYSTQQLF